MRYDAIVVGGGMAGLTTTAYLASAGYKVLLCEKEPKIGGLVNSFNYQGFVFDGGIRSIESSGIVFPMLAQLGIKIDLVKSHVSLGLKEHILAVDSKDSLYEYQKLLIANFPENVTDIQNIIAEIKKIMKYMDILYGIDNPLFMNLAKNKQYLFQTVIPWSFKFMLTIKKINDLNEPVNDYLAKFTKNQALIDIIGQHFFKATPTFFALSYFSLYMDYHYPKNGTGALPEKMASFILDNNGTILKNTKVVNVDLKKRIILADNNESYSYKELVWTADLKRLYQAISLDKIENPTLENLVQQQRNFLEDKHGGDSVLTVYQTVDLPLSYFQKLTTEHLFYTPQLKGLSQVALSEIIDGRDSQQIMYSNDKTKVFEWLQRFFNYTTYEISIPALRNPLLAPAGKTGLIISTLVDYSLIKHFKDMGWYQEFKEFTQKQVSKVLASSIFPDYQAKIMDQLVSTPLTIARITGNTDGAITGWSFTNHSIPAVSKMTKVTKAVLTDLPHVLKAGQWSYSPSGLPISVMTGKIAANQVIKNLKKAV